MEDGKALKREFKFADFYRAMSFVNAVAHIANVEDHHPDIECGWGYCRIRYQTHSIGGLHENDFICAAKIDDLPRLKIGRPDDLTRCANAVGNLGEARATSCPVPLAYTRIARRLRGNHPPEIDPVVMQQRGIARRQ